MRKTILVLAGSVALGMSATAAAQDNQADTSRATSPAQICHAQRQAIGATAFAALYGTNANRRNAFGKCVAKAQHQSDQATTTAKATCSTEQQADPASFAVRYGTNRNRRNAFGKCVATHASQAIAAQQRTTVTAAKQCKTELHADPAGFAIKFGTNRNRRNAFGRCVSAKVAAHATPSDR
jgi:hypothetical protein